MVLIENVSLEVQSEIRSHMTSERQTLLVTVHLWISLQQVMPMEVPMSRQRTDCSKEATHLLLQWTDNFVGGTCIRVSKRSQYEMFLDDVGSKQVTV